MPGIIQLEAFSGRVGANPNPICHAVLDRAYVDLAQSIAKIMGRLRQETRGAPQPAPDPIDRMLCIIHVIKGMTPFSRPFWGRGKTDEALPRKGSGGVPDGYLDSLYGGGEGLRPFDTLTVRLCSPYLRSPRRVERRAA